MPQLISEAVDLSASPISKAGRIRIKIIDAGTGSSGVYPAETLEAAGKAKVFHSGLHMYADHPSVMENMDRPERTIKDLAAVLESDAVYEDGALYADAKVYPHWREVISEMAADIGVSIRASAEVDDSSDPITITKLVSAESVDFVTHAGRGGKVMEVLESARAKERAIAHGVEEATVNNTRNWLQDAVRDANPGGWAWVRDFDETLVYFERDVDGPDGRVTERLFMQAYTLNGNSATLTGEPVEVKAETVYTPVTNHTAEESARKDSPSSTAGVTEKKEAATMATTTIEESEYATLKENASRATTLENELKEAREELAAAREAELRATVTGIVNEAFDGVDAPKGKARLIESLVNAEEFDADKAKAAAVEEAAEYRAANGEGDVRGLGSTGAVIESKTYSDDDIVGALDGGK